MIIVSLLLAAVNAGGLQTEGFDGAGPVYSARSGGEGRTRLSLSGEGWSAGGMLLSATGDSMHAAPKAASFPWGADLRATVQYGWTTWADFGVSIPFHMENSVDDASIPQSGRGDVRMSLKLQLPLGMTDRFLDAAFYGVASIPSGQRGAGLFPRQLGDIPLYVRDNDQGSSAFGGDGLGLSGGGILTLDWSSVSPVWFRNHFNWGIRTTTATSRSPLYNLSTGLEVDLGKHATAWGYLAAQWAVRYDSATRSFPTTTGGGVTLHPLKWLYLQGGVDVTLLPGSARHMIWKQPGQDRRLDYFVYPLPDSKVHAQIVLEFPDGEPDSDGDGIPDLLDKCPERAEDKDGFQDADGCPDPDNDGDLVPDGRDQCPLVAEDRDGYQDGDGCPDPDNDGDGICDPWVAENGLSAMYASICKGSDRCANQVEDMDGYKDEDGCPDFDNDGDGIPDALDQCPNSPEDLDGFQDTDGCPDDDNDSDGIRDSVDQCPNTPEDIEGFQDDDGCPDYGVGDSTKVDSLKPKLPRIKAIIDSSWPDSARIHFETGLDLLDPNELNILDRIADWLRDHPERNALVVGHADSRGEAEKNQDLSERRARRVVQALVDRGVERTRLRAVGRSSFDPERLNFEGDDRQRNRRVEITLEEP